MCSSTLGRNRYGTIPNIHLTLRAYLYFLSGALFVNDLCTCKNKSTFSEKNSAVNVNNNVKNFAVETTANKKRDFKRGYLFRTFSVATNQVTSIEFLSDWCYYAGPFLANYGSVPYSPIFIPIAALLQAVLQEKTEPLRNGLLETRNRTV